MRPGIFHRAFLFLFPGLAIAALATATAGAAEPTVYELPDATHARSLAAAEDGTVWFVPTRGSEGEGAGGSIIGALAPDGTVTEHEVAGFGEIDGLTLGPTGKIWVSGADENAAGETLLEIGRLSASSELTQRFTIGRAQGGWDSLRQLTVADGAVWFVRDRLTRRDTIGRLSIADGAVRRFVSRPRCHVAALAAGAAGALWFTEGCWVDRGGFEGWTPGNSSIARISPGGKIARYPLHGSRDTPISLAIEPTETVWFGVTYRKPSGYSAEKVGRLTKDGALAEFPTPDALPYSIAIGPERRLWFQSSFGGWNYRALGSIGPAGKIAKPICADPTCQLKPTGLTAAPDHSLFYGLAQPNLNTGGGGSGLGIDMEIANEAGFIAHLVVR
jgi:streptogramin lyase